MRLKCDFRALLSIHIIYSLTKLQAVLCSVGNLEKRERSSFYANDAGDTVVASQFYTGLDKDQSSDQWSNKERHLPIKTQFERGNFPIKFQEGIDRLPQIGIEHQQRESQYVRKSGNSKYYDSEPKDEDNSLDKLLRSEQRAKSVAEKQDGSKKDHSKQVKSARKGLFSRKMNKKVTSRRNSNRLIGSSEHEKYVQSYRRRKHKKKNSATPTEPTKASTEADNFNWDFPIFDEVERKPSAFNSKSKKQEIPKNRESSDRKRNQGSLSVADEAKLENSHQDQPSETSVRTRTLADRLKHRQLDMNKRKLSGLRSNGEHKPEMMRRLKSDSKFRTDEAQKEDIIGEPTKIDHHRRKPYTNHRVKISDFSETNFAQKVGSWDVFYPTERTNSKFENTDRSEDAKSSWVVVSPTAEVKRQRQRKPQIIPHLKDNSLRKGTPKSTNKLEDQRKAEFKGNNENRQDIGKNRETVKPIPVPEVKNVKLDPKYEPKLGKNSNSDTPEKSNPEKSNPEKINPEKINPEKSNSDNNRSNELQANDIEEREDTSADDPAANGHLENEWINRKQLEKMLNENQGLGGKLRGLGKTETKGQGGNNGVEQQEKPQKPIFIDDKATNQNDRPEEDRANFVHKKVPHNEDPQNSFQGVKPSGKTTAESQTINASAGMRNNQADNASLATQTRNKQNNQPQESDGKESEKKTGETSSPAKATVKKSGKEIKYVVFDPAEFTAPKLRAVLQEFDQPVGQVPHCSLDEYQWERARVLKSIKRREGNDKLSRTDEPEANKSFEQQKQINTPVNADIGHASFKTDLKSKRAADFQHLSEIMERLMAKGEASPQMRERNAKNGQPDAQEDRIISKYLTALMEDHSKRQTNGSDSSWLQMLLAELAENRKKNQIVHA